MFEKSCELEVHRMRYRLHPSSPEAEVSTYSTEFDGSQDFSNALLDLEYVPASERPQQRARGALSPRFMNRQPFCRV